MVDIMKVIIHKNIDTKTNSRMLTVFTIYIIYITDSIFFSTNSNNVLILLSRILPVIVAIYFIIKYRSRIISVRCAVAYLVCISVFFSMINANRLTNGYFYITIIACLLFGFFFSLQYSIEEFAYSYVRIMTIIAIVSIVCEVGKYFLYNLSILPTLTNSTGVNYKHIVLTSFTIRNGALRNQGPFWEPGAYQVYLNVALLLSLFCEKDSRIKLFHSILFCITLITTGSGIAILPAILIIFAYMLNEKISKSFIILLISVFAFFIFYQTGFLDSVFGRMNTGETSFQLRLYSILGNLYAFIQNPIFGSPVEESYAYREEIIRRWTGFTYSFNLNTFPAYFAYLGILPGTYFVVNLFLMAKSMSKRTIPALLIFIAIILSTSNENMVSSIFICTLVMLRSKELYAI